MLNISIIDDSIPINGDIEVDDTTYISQSLLNLMISRNTWDDTNIKSLIEKLIADKSNWRTTAFTSPEIYLNEIRRGFSIPDILVFDWEYSNPKGTEIGKLLLEILEKSFVLVYIYTGSDFKKQVLRRVALDDLNSYFNKRLRMLMKDESDNSPAQLIEQSKQLCEGNFSFRFGTLLREASRDSVEKILSALGVHHIDFIKDFLSEPETKETDIKTLLAEKVAAHILENNALLDELVTTESLDRTKAENLLKIIKAKFRDEVRSIDINSFGSGAGGTTDLDALKQLWSYRLYYHPSDNQVRKGDIIKKKEGDNYYLVVTPDCYLSRFWRKNFGYINLIPLWDISNQAQEIKEMLCLTHKDNSVKRIIKNAESSSISNQVKGFPDGCFLLPYVKDNANISSLIGFSKAIRSELIDPKTLAPGESAEKRENHSLDYGHWIKYRRISTISEPFVTPIIQIALDAIEGVGTPDFSEHIKKDLRARFQQTHDALWPTP